MKIMTSTTSTKFIVSKFSGIHAGSCIIGTGDTKQQALEDAYGPKPWSPYAKKSMRDACVREVSMEEYEEICFH
jgi:hypothetical protein